MDFITNFWSRRTARAQQSYKLVGFGDDEEKTGNPQSQSSFLWKEWWAFLTIGMGMMWTWMMILTAVPYLQKRFREDGWIASHFESCILITFAITLLGVTIVLTRTRRNVSYPNRLHGSFVSCMIISVLLSLSTVNLASISSKSYFVFLLIAVLGTALANGLCQNAAFALVAGFNEARYTQAVVTGQAVAGILPPLIEVLSTLSIPESHKKAKVSKYETSFTTLVYFLSGILINAMALLALKFLRRRRRGRPASEGDMSMSSLNDNELDTFDGNSMLMSINRQYKPGHAFRILWRKLAWPSAAVFFCICLSSLYPVFASEIVSVSEKSSGSRLLQADAFIPLAFGIWNLGELFGSLLSVLPPPSRQPRLIFILSIARIGFIPLYKLCNVNGNGAIIVSDTFYLFVVQFLFGVTEGWLGGICVIGISEWVDEAEREAAGALMGLSIVAGMAAGSLVSLAVT